MVTLARHHGLSPVGQAPSVNCTALKRRLVDSPAPQASRTDAVSAGFVEVPVTAWPPDPSGQWVMELEDRGATATKSLESARRTSVQPVFWAAGPVARARLTLGTWPMSSRNAW